MIKSTTPTTRKDTNDDGRDPKKPALLRRSLGISTHFEAKKNAYSQNAKGRSHAFFFDYSVSLFFGVELFEEAHKPKVLAMLAEFMEVVMEL